MESHDAIDPDQIRRRIEVRIGQGEFLAGMLHVARRTSADTQESFVGRLCNIATAVRAILDLNGCIKRLDYRPQQFWPSIKGQAIAFLDGGVANIDLPSAAPVGIRVGSYIVRPGETDPGFREQFNIELSIVDDLYANDGELYDNDFLDVAKLRDAARIISETAAVWRLASGENPPDFVLLHGPLVNPAAPYGLDGFPAYGLEACQIFLGDSSWSPDDDQRQFVGLYLELLDRIKAAGRTTIGVVERSIGKDPVVTRYLLNSLQDAGKMKKGEAKRLLDQILLYGLNDATLFDVVLQEGEFLAPVSVMRQGPENKWPDAWKERIRAYPNALTTYLKPSETTLPFRVEAFDTVSNLDRALDLVLHTSRLLPSYGFPVGLDIVDKFAKVPDWMSRSVRGQHQVVLLQKALASGDPRALTFAKRVLAAKGRDWFFRPSA
ncbi:MAG: DNA double-strand break repair nuclease NurA [Caulobacteraceae bacterium]